MIRKFIIICAVMVFAMAKLPLNKSPPDDNDRPVHFLAKAIMERKFQQSEYRLPCNTVPRVYIIDIDPDFLGEKFTFTGNGTIIIEVLRPTTTVTLHKSYKLDIDKHETELIDDNGNVKKPISQKWNSVNNFLSIKFTAKLSVGNYSLKMSWSGRDGRYDWYNPLSGFYRAIDKDENGEPKYLITTHFEPSGARQVFPCWDEPGIKAQFEFSIKHYSNYTALSNMPVKNSEVLSDGRVLTRFERSPKMSSYLPCLTVADYKRIENAHGNITFYTLERNLNSLKYALEVSEKVIPAMEFYTDMPYAFPKLDQVTIPQYGATAMEHWGLVSYVTRSVLTHNGTLIPDIAKKEAIELLIAHELAHQWFGNLVTPIWWSDAWLNEAFAAYFQYKAVELIYPKRRVMDLFVIEHVNDGSFPSERYSNKPKPIKWNPKTYMQVEQMFSAVTYAKGAGVLHMLDHNILGEEIFRDGIRRYMKAHKFTAVNTDDLWDDLQEAYDEKNKEKPLNIKEIMDPWIEQTGYPIIKVTRNYDTGDVFLTQKNAMSTNPNNKWKIPLNYATKSDPDFSSTLPKIWFNKNDDNITIPNINKDDWIILNIQQKGFYTVDYDNENWRLIADYLNTDNYNKISPVNRAQLIEDSFKKLDHSEFDFENLEILINITSYLYRETDYLPWIPATKIIDRFADMMRNTPDEELHKKYLLYLMRKILDHIDIDNDYIGLKTKLLLLPFACEFGHDVCRNSAKEIFNKYLENPTSEIFTNYKNSWIICIGLEEANETLWDSLIQTVNNTNLIYTPYNYLKCTKSKEIRDKYMNRMFMTNLTDDMSQVILINSQFKHNNENMNYILDYFINNFEMIKKYFNDNHEPDYVLVMIAELNMAIKTREQSEKMKSFMEPRLEEFKTKYEEFEIEDLPNELENGINLVESRSNLFHSLMDKRLFGPNAIKMDKN